MTCARTLIEIQSRSTVPDEIGGRSTDWVKVISTFATPRFVKGRESDTSSDGDQVSAIETWLMKVRFTDKITTDMRVFWRNQPYNIRSATDREQKGRFITLEIEKGVAE